MFLCELKKESKYFSLKAKYKFKLPSFSNWLQEGKDKNGSKWKGASIYLSDNACFCWASIPLNIYTHFCDACPWKVVLGIPGVRNKLGKLKSNKVFLVTPMQLVIRRTGGFCVDKTFRLEISSLVNNTSLQYHANTLFLKNHTQSLS